MKISITYKDDIRPIREATIHPAGGSVVNIVVLSDDTSLKHGHNVRFVLNNTTNTYSKQEFAEFTELINRINKQIGN